MRNITMGTIFYKILFSCGRIFRDRSKTVLPDEAVREYSKFTEKYKDYIHLGFLEWKKVYAEHLKLAVFFVMR